MLMDEGMDTGDILEQITVDIGEEETAGELTDRLANAGAVDAATNANNVLGGLAEANQGIVTDSAGGGVPGLGTADGVGLDASQGKWGSAGGRAAGALAGSTFGPAGTFIGGFLGGQAGNFLDRLW